jgi:hypothetical protein
MSRTEKCTPRKAMPTLWGLMLMLLALKFASGQGVPVVTWIARFLLRS